MTRLQRTIILCTVLALLAGTGLAASADGSPGKTPYLFSGDTLVSTNALQTAVTLNLQYDDFVPLIKPQWIVLGEGLKFAQIKEIKRLDEQTLQLSLTGKLDLKQKQGVITLAPEAITRMKQLQVRVPIVQPVLHCVPRNLSYQQGKSGTWQLELVAMNCDFSSQIKAGNFTFSGALKNIKIKKLTWVDRNHLKLELTGKILKQKTAVLQVAPVGTGGATATRVTIGITGLQ